MPNCSPAHQHFVLGPHLHHRWSHGLKQKPTTYQTTVAKCLKHIYIFRFRQSPCSFFWCINQVRSLESKICWQRGNRGGTCARKGAPIKGQYLHAEDQSYVLPFGLACVHKHIQYPTGRTWLHPDHQRIMLEPKWLLSKGVWWDDLEKWKLFVCEKTLEAIFCDTTCPFPARFCCLCIESLGRQIFK